MVKIFSKLNRYGEVTEIYRSSHPSYLWETEATKAPFKKQLYSANAYLYIRFVYNN
jgi:hypothetical protein